MCVPDQQPAAPLPGAPGSAGEAVGMVLAGLGWLATAEEVASLPAVVLAGALRGLEQAIGVHTAARSRVLSAFTAQAGHEEDGQGSPGAWLRWQTRVTSGAASAAVGWARRLRAHPAVAGALAGLEISESWARLVCDWSDRLPADARADADLILLAAARGGAGLDDLASLADQIRSHVTPPDKDDDDGFEDRRVWLSTTFDGAGTLRGDLTPACATALRAVLDALGKKADRSDLRSKAQRDHDALLEALTRLIATDCLPARAGQPTTIMLHADLDDVLARAEADAGHDGSGDDGVGQRGPGVGDASAGAGHDDSGDDGVGQRSASAGDEPARDRECREPRPAWPGPAARPGDLCDARIIPIVTGRVDHDLLDQLAASLAVRLVGVSRDELRELLLSHAVALLSGPGGLASVLRTGTLPRPAGSVSLPLDVGTATDTIPPHLRRAVIARDKHCGAPGCFQPPDACDVHHIIPRSRGGPTKLTSLILLCRFHHLIYVHQWGWTITLNADGTTTATSPDRTRQFHSHSPPTAAA